MEKPKRIRGVSPQVQESAERLRKQMTPAEQTLWQALRETRFRQWRIRRQHPLGKFILDFCVTSHRLAIEVDGSIHDLQQEHDAERTTMLEAYGYRVIRFRNEEVEQDLEKVLQCIEDTLNQ
ncbi:MAG: DUF559 domain-containing protein [Armatimonadetes bacterium]|nr:DUF559 domain-containing protein [Armatimonadota bacterium]